MADDFCWSCRQHKNNVNGTKGEYHSGICRDCIDDQEAKLKQFNAELILKDRPPQFSSCHDGDVIIKDVSVRLNGETYFIRGFSTCTAPYGSSEVFNLVNQFIGSGFKWLRLYGNFDLLKKYDFWFEIQKFRQFYEFSGNCNQYSNAFCLRTLDINQIWEYVEVWTKIPDKLKMRVKAQVDKKLVFASAPEPHSAEKAFCFQDFSNYKETRKSVIIPIKGFVPQVPEQTGAV